MKKLCFSILLILIINSLSFGQEIITNLQFNPSLEVRDAKIVPTKSSKSQKYIPLKLPFIDDFSTGGVFPDSSRWIDNYAYINTDFPKFPISIGVATMDALNDTGAVYAHGSQYPFIADHLTSKPIRLDSIFGGTPHAVTVQDSIFISFFFQPKGYGNAPEKNDSLTLEFLYYTGDSVFSYTDTVYTSVDLIIKTDSNNLKAGDTIFLHCYNVWVAVNNVIDLGDDTLYPSDFLWLPCDSIFVPKTRWRWAWSSEGMRLDTFLARNNDYWFKQVIVQIDDTVFFDKYFQFRFRNYASLGVNELPSWQSNVDQWHIDYIYLDHNRSPRDTVYEDFTFIERPPSLLKNYEEMPYRQFKSNPQEEMRDTFYILQANLDIAAHQYAYKYEVFDESGSSIFLYPGAAGSSCNINPFFTYGYKPCGEQGCPNACPPFDFTIPINSGDSAIFKIEHIIIESSLNWIRSNDTISHIQKFYNYYAYDDGSAEAGYGLTPAGSQLAYRFQLNEMDTLRAIQIYFNRTLTAANQQYFEMMVWNDNNGIPGNVKYLSNPLVRPEFGDSLNKFHTYYLDEMIIIDDGEFPGLVFYVGMKQKTDDNLNIGYDMRHDAAKNTFFNTSGIWENSAYNGALMIRPALGADINPDKKQEKNTESDQLDIYPNPAVAGMINVEIPFKYTVNYSDNDFTTRIYTIFGSLVYENVYKKETDIYALRKGMYIIEVTNNINKQVFKNKLVIAL
ncbi:MAG: T9SS type A sorting domain-containing protein [Bacteroidales bacterium]|nr:T9SS type A sorting domain-containing protein [Bacteroidales bacterium]